MEVVEDELIFYFLGPKTERVILYIGDIIFIREHHNIEPETDLYIEMPLEVVGDVIQFPIYFQKK